MTDKLINNLILLQESYKKKVHEIDINIKRKFFVPVYKEHEQKASIKAYDDMYYEMYFKSKYFDLNVMNNINIELQNSGNIINDIKLLMSRIDIKFLHDNKFKISKSLSDKDKNYFNIKDEKEVILYNSIDKNTYQQSEFRKQIFKIENILKNEYTKIYNKDITLSFYDDQKYDMVWIIISIINR